MPRIKRAPKEKIPQYPRLFIAYITTKVSLPFNPDDPDAWECTLEVLSDTASDTQGEAEMHAYHKAQDRAKAENGNVYASQIVDQDTQHKTAIYRVNFKNGGYAIYGVIPSRLLNNANIEIIYPMMRALHAKPAPKSSTQERYN